MKILLFLENNHKFLLAVAAAETISKYFHHAKYYVRHFICSSLLILRTIFNFGYHILFTNNHNS